MAETPKTDAQALFRQAVALQQAGRYGEAAAIYQSLLKANPQNFDLNHLAGVALFQQGLPDQALALIKTALRLKPDSAAALGNAGSVQEALGDTKAALLSYNKAIAAQPGFYPAHFKKGRLLQAQGRLEEAMESYDAAQALQDNDPNLHNNKGAALRDIGRAAEALESFDRAIALQPQGINAYVNKANTLYDMGRAAEAQALYDHALALDGHHAGALIGRGRALQTQGDLDAALASFDLAVQHHPKLAEAHSLRAALLLQRGEDAAALDSLDAALRIENDNAATVRAAARALMDAGRLDEALAEFDRALALDPESAQTWAYRASLLKAMKRPLDAVGSYDRAIALAPQYDQAHTNRAVLLQHLRRHDEAVAGFMRAIELNPQSLAAYANLGNLMQELRQYEAAIRYYDAALKIDARSAVTLYNRGQALAQLRRHKEAARDYDRALQLDPAHPSLPGIRLYTKMLLCDWSACGEIPAFLDNVRKRRIAAQPFSLIGLPATPQDQLICAQEHMTRRYPPLPALWTGQARAPGRIRVGYVSADLHRHATAYLMAGLFEQHDRDTFEVHAFSFGPDDKSALRARLESSFHAFHDVARKTDEEVAQLALASGIDILVDLKGYTQDSRPGIFARRAAPLQVAYIGYPGTMAAPYIDYFVGDRRAVTPGIAAAFTEKIIYLPDSYQVNDDKRFLPAAPARREDHGLPPEGFVFCSFNNSYKLTPDFFDVWMRLLAAVPGSVLWLFEGSDGTQENLRREAQARGVDPARLVFAPKMPLEEHLARQQCADLFLDSIPCNAHTTASDALWVGLPVLTCMGNTFAGRVAGSLLHAHGLPELITHDIRDYEAAALDIARHPQKLAALRDKTLAQRTRGALFDTARSTSHLESAWRTIWERHQQGLAPESFDVAPLPAREWP